MIEYVVSFIGGVLSVFSPCILPVLPVIFATSEGSWWKSILVVMGLVLSFGILGLIFGILGSAFSYVSFIILFIFGLILLFDVKISQTADLSNYIGRKMIRSSASSFYPFILGMSLGAVWSPCIGPILGAIIGLVAVSGSAVSGFLLMICYALGMALVISAILLTGSRVSGRWVENQSMVNRIFGAIILVFLFLMISGILDSFELFLSTKLEPFEEFVSEVMNKFKFLG
jgi:cytochrome c-type biogenesis protein